MLCSSSIRDPSLRCVSHVYFKGGVNMAMRTTGSCPSFFRPWGIPGGAVPQVPGPYSILSSPMVQTACPERI